MGTYLKRMFISVLFSTDNRVYFRRENLFYYIVDKISSFNEWFIISTSIT